MKDIQQLIKKNSQEGRYEDIFPKTFIDAVLDKESGVTLTDILAMFNMLFLSYNGSRSQTRLQVPSSLRREGLWITYVLYDKTVVTEWYSAEAIDDTTFGDSANWRDGSNALVGDISISSDGYWVINGEVTNIKAQGEAGITPILRVGSNNHLQVSYTNGSTYVDVSPNPVFTQFRVSNNKLEQSVDLGLTWTVASDYIAAWFRFTGTTGSSQADNVGKIQISRDNGATWSDLSGEFTNSLHIKGYVATVDALPSTAVQGDIYGVGPTYDPSDTEHTNPIYQLHVKNSTGWVNNGKFTSIAAGVVQTTGTSTTEVMSQDAVSKEFASVRSDLLQYVSVSQNTETSGKTKLTVGGVDYNLANTGKEETTSGDNIYTEIGYIKWSDGIITSSGYHSSEFIPVVKGMIIRADNAKCSSAVAILAAYSSNNESSYIQAKSIRGSSDSGFKYIVPDGVNYVRLCCDDSITFSGITIDIISDTLYVKREDVENILSANQRKVPASALLKSINDDVNGTSTTISGSNAFPNTGYIKWTDGTVTSSGYYASDMLPVRIASVITLSGFSTSGSVAKLAAYDSSGTYLQSLSIRGGSSSANTYRVPDGVAFIRVCTDSISRASASIQIAIASKYVNRSDIENQYSKDDFKAPCSRIVRELIIGKSFTKDDLTTSGSLIYINNGGIITHSDFKCSSIFYPVTAGKKYSCLFCAEGTAGVCFYNSSETYLNSYWQSSGRAREVFTVPDGASFMRICNRTTVVADPIFTEVNDAYDDLTTLTDKVKNLQPKVPEFSKGIIRLYPQTKLPCVSFQFDDLNYRDDLLVTLFESYKLTCAFAFIASTSNITNKAAQYKDYQGRGFQIMNHSVDGTVFNLTNYTYQTALETIATSLNRIQDTGMVCNGFVSPSSSMEASFMPILKMFHSYAFTDVTTDATANGRSQNTCDLHRYSLESHTVAEIEQYIDDCITNDQIMTFYGHAANLVDGGDTSVFSLAKIAAVIEYCITKRNAGLLYIGGTDDCVKYFFDL